MDRLQVCKLVVIGIHTNAEEQTGVTTVDDLVVAELEPGEHISKWQGRSAITNLNEVWLVFLVSRSYQSMHFTPKTDLYKKVVISLEL